MIQTDSCANVRVARAGAECFELVGLTAVGTEFSGCCFGHLESNLNLKSEVLILINPINLESTVMDASGAVSSALAYSSLTVGSLKVLFCKKTDCFSLG